MKGRPCVHPGCSMPRPTLGSSHNAHVRHNNKVPPHDNTNSPPPGALYYPVLTLVLHTTTLYYAVLHRTTQYEVVLQTTTLYSPGLPGTLLCRKAQLTFSQTWHRKKRRHFLLRSLTKRAPNQSLLHHPLGQPGIHNKVNPPTIIQTPLPWRLVLSSTDLCTTHYYVVLRSTTSHYNIRGCTTDYYLVLQTTTLCSPWLEAPNWHHFCAGLQTLFFNFV